MENVFYGDGGLCQKCPLLQQAGYDPFDQRNLGVLKALKAPPVELEAEHAILTLQGCFHHLQDAGLSGAPVSVNAKGDRVSGVLFQERDNRLRDGLIV